MASSHRRRNGGSRGLYTGDGGYELWDTETANMIGCYASRHEALADVAEIAAEHGAASPEARHLALYHDGEDEESLVGEALIRAALAESPEHATPRRA